MPNNLSALALKGRSPSFAAAAQSAERAASAIRDRRVKQAQVKRDRVTRRTQAAMKKADEEYRAECAAAADAWHEASEQFFSRPDV